MFKLIKLYITIELRVTITKLKTSFSLKYAATLILVHKNFYKQFKFIKKKKYSNYQVKNKNILLKKTIKLLLSFKKFTNACFLNNIKFNKIHKIVFHLKTFLIKWKCWLNKKCVFVYIFKDSINYILFFKNWLKNIMKDLT